MNGNCCIAGGNGHGLGTAEGRAYLADLRGLCARYVRDIGRCTGRGGCGCASRW